MTEAQERGYLLLLYAEGFLQRVDAELYRMAGREDRAQTHLGTAGDELLAARLAMVGTTADSPLMKGYQFDTECLVVMGLVGAAAQLGHAYEEMRKLSREGSQAGAHVQTAIDELVRAEKDWIKGE